MKAPAEGINGSNVMEKCQCLSSQAGIRMPLQNHLLLFPQPQLTAAAAAAGLLGLTSAFSLCCWSGGGNSTIPWGKSRPVAALFVLLIVEMQTPFPVTPA